jgi:ferritin-like metal-binding protein YciE
MVMREQALEQFIGVLKDRREGQENALETMEKRPASADTGINDLLKAIPQAHINELDFVIEELEQILDSSASGFQTEVRIDLPRR